MLPLFISFLILSSFFSGECSSSESLVPAFYVFGDSILDAGNNNRVNFRPYGIDFPEGITGRFTNGKTLADLIAGYLGLPYPTPYGGVPRSQQGYLYASAGRGILQETGIHLGGWPLDEQLSLFQKTKDEELTPIYGDSTDEYLAKSIFLVWIGSNDYLLNYFNDENPAYNPQEFAQLLIDRLSDQLKALHEMGARKLVVLETAPLGCLPVYRKNNGQNATWCDVDKNANVRMFNEGLALLIQTLTTTYPDSHFTLGKVYDINDDAFKNPHKYGLTNVHEACCATSKEYRNNIPCIPLLLPWQRPCPNRREYLFFDGAHPTEASFEMLAIPCFSGSDVCVPYNIQQLAQLPINSANLHSAA